MNEIITNHESLAVRAVEALKEVLDPEIGLNIVDLGLVYQLDFDEAEKKAFVRMTLTTQFCPMGDSIQNAARQAMEQAFPEFKIDLHLVFDPPWSQNRISEVGKEFLNG